VGENARQTRIDDHCKGHYTRRTWVIGFQGAWIWVQDKAGNTQAYHSYGKHF
jgi:hypothetical protein